MHIMKHSRLSSKILHVCGICIVCVCVQAYILGNHWLLLHVFPCCSPSYFLRHGFSLCLGLLLCLEWLASEPQRFSFILLLSTVPPQVLESELIAWCLCSRYVIDGAVSASLWYYFWCSKNSRKSITMEVIFNLIKAVWLTNALSIMW